MIFAHLNGTRVVFEVRDNVPRWEVHVPVLLKGHMTSLKQLSPGWNIDQVALIMFGKS